MRSWTIAFLLGVLITQTFPSLPTTFQCWCLFLIVLTAGAAFTAIPAIFPSFPRRRESSQPCMDFWLPTLARMMWGVLLGITWTCLYASIVMTWTLPADWQGKDILVSGIIDSVPIQSKRSLRFEFQVNAFQFQRQTINKKVRVRLSWYGKFPELKVGDQWQLVARLKRPHGFANLGSFDLEKSLLQHHIRATGYVRASSKNKLIASHQTNHFIDRFRQNIANRVQEVLADSPNKGLITGLTLGIKQDISFSQWQVFRKTGTSHLMAISGLHIGLIASMFYALVNFLWRRSFRLTLKIPAQVAAAAAAIFGALLYAAMAGFSLPTQRALVMISVYMGAVLFRKNLAVWQGVCLAILVILILDPLSTLSPGFWLSFCAVSIIIYGVAGRLRPKGLWWKWGRAQWVVTLGLFPISLLYFQQIPLLAFIANLIAIPFVGFLVVPLSLLGSITVLFLPTLGAGFLFLADKLLVFLWPLLRFLSNTDSLQWHHGIVNGWTLLFSAIGLLIVLAPKGWPARWLGLFYFLPLLFLKTETPNYAEFNFTLLDVGQGLASIVRTQHHVLVFDTGPKFSDHFDTGNAVVVPYLRTLGLNKVDVLMISHADNDHIGGANSLMHQLSVNKILSSVPERFTHPNNYFCKGGQSWEWDGVSFDVLYPIKYETKRNNDNSCVIRISNQYHSILLTGDIEKFAERQLLNSHQNLSSEVIVAPHHGSKTSSTYPFIRAVNPSLVLFPVGYRNRFHFPNLFIQKRYEVLGAKAFRTDGSGELDIKIPNAKTKLSVLPYRAINRRYWR